MPARVLTPARTQELPADGDGLKFQNALAFLRPVTVRRVIDALLASSISENKRHMGHDKAEIFQGYEVYKQVMTFLPVQ